MPPGKSFKSAYNDDSENHLPNDGDVTNNESSRRVAREMWVGIELTWGMIFEDFFKVIESEVKQDL